MTWKSASSSNDETAREPRQSKLVSLQLSSARYDRVQIVVRNLAPHGLGARADIELLPCEQVTVHMPDGRSMGAIVRWVKKNSFGLALEERIDPGQFQLRVSTAAIVPKDAQIGFAVRPPETLIARSGFQRNHRDEVLRTSDWLSNS